jgi:hypothetical protein
MDLELVTDAVRRLHAENQKATARAVQALTRGSMRDVQRFLRDAKEFLADDEVADLDAEVAEPMAPPSLGRIIETFQATQLADHEAGVASAVLDETRDQLWDLLAHRPPPAVDPENVSDSVAARIEHAAMVATLQDEVDQLQRVVEANQAEARAFRLERDKLQVRAQELRDAILPSGRRGLAEAQQDLYCLKAELIHTVGLAEQRVERIGQALIAYEAELQSLVGG